MDATLARWLNDQATHHALLEHVATWAAAHLAVVLLATLALGWTGAALRDLRANHQVSWRLVQLPLYTGLTLAIGLAVNQLLGHAWFRPRPYDTLTAIHPLLPPSADPSFPSDHATFAAALTLAVLPTLPWLGRLLLVEGVLLVVSRVAVGLHYPGDVFGGLLIALAAAMVADQVIVRLRGHLVGLATHQRLRVLRVAPPATLAVASHRLFTAGLGAALLGVPLLVEAVDDPVRMHPEWLEAITLGVAAVALTALWLVLIRRPRHGAVGNRRSRPVAM